MTKQIQRKFTPQEKVAITPLDKGFAELIAIANDDMGSVWRVILSLHIKAHVVMVGARGMAK